VKTADLRNQGKTIITLTHKWEDNINKGRSYRNEVLLCGLDSNSSG